MPGSEDSTSNVSDDSMNYWLGATVPPGVHPGDTYVIMFKKFQRAFACPEDATTDQEIKIRPSDGDAALVNLDDSYGEHSEYYTIFFLLLILFQSW